MLGTALPLSILPGLEMMLEYRLFGLANADVPVHRTAANTTNLINGSVPGNETRNGFGLSDNAVLVGLRYSFGGR